MEGKAGMFSMSKDMNGTISWDGSTAEPLNPGHLSWRPWEHLPWGEEAKAGHVPAVPSLIWDPDPAGLISSASGSL